MNQAEYDRVADGLLELAESIETSKRPGYTGGSSDVLHNFKGVAGRIGVTPEQVWLTYFLKHIDAVTTIMSRPDLPVSEAAPGRFADAINYLRLGYAMWVEREHVVIEEDDPWGTCEARGEESRTDAGQAKALLNAMLATDYARRDLKDRQ